MSIFVAQTVGDCDGCQESILDGDDCFCQECFATLRIELEAAQKTIETLSHHIDFLTAKLVG